MALFKCKMCGGDLEIAEGVTIAECEYCGTKQTVPKAMDENLQNLFNRANTLRIKSEFDKAEKIYEKIIQADSTQSEAYWGLILCKYGIEYVDDPKTYKKIPTCHRASYDSIIADDDYKAAIEYADMSQRILYEEQAKEIDRIQKDILALAQKEETYDVFICYKETDANGSRTHDSVIANEIYYQLTDEGFKVFFAAITLEGKLGSAYEPIIFAALNSAKVMLAIGTKPEYFNAVWVKNEWSRFLKIIKTDRSKLLIPCYRDMDAYELPEEFAHLQAQDMSKIGFINDIVRGIKKVIKKDEPKPQTVVKETIVKETVVSGTSANASNIDALLKRAFMFLEDGDWKSAEEYCEKVLDIDPENGQAYLGKLMSALRVKKQQNLAKQSISFASNVNYQKIMRFGGDALKAELAGYIAQINQAHFTNTYSAAIYRMERATTAKEYREAEKLFNQVSGYKEASLLASECTRRAAKLEAKENELNAAIQRMGFKGKDVIERAKNALTNSQGKDAQALIDLAFEYLNKKEDVEAQVVFNLIIEKLPNERLGYIGKAVSLVVNDGKNVSYDSLFAPVMTAKDKEVSRQFASATQKLIEYPCGEYDLTLLVHACSAIRFGVVQALVYMGADVNKKTKHNTTPLWYVCFKELSADKRKDGIEIARLLLDKGVEVDVTNNGGIALYNQATDPAIGRMITSRYKIKKQNGKPQSSNLSSVASGSGWGTFLTVSMILFCLFPITGLLISGIGLLSDKSGQMTNINVKVAKITLIMNIIATIVVPILIFLSVQ